MAPLSHRIEQSRNRRAFTRAPDVPGFDTRVLETPAGQVRTVVIDGAPGRPTVLLSMDPPMALEHHASTLAMVAERHRVVAFEIPGFAFSRVAPDFGFTLEAYASAFGHVLDQTDTKDAIFCSPCFNNLPAFRYAVHHPERVRAFVGTQAPSWTDALRWIKRTDRVGLFRLPVLGQLITWGLSYQVQKAWLKIAEPDVALRAAYTEQARALHRQGALYCLATGIQALAPEDPFAGQVLARPAALLWGAADPSHRPTAADSFAQYLERPKLLVAESAGHFPELTRPDLLVEAIRSVG
jgi:pimeloyl-ACP methyl ester carboxylesterase